MGAQNIINATLGGAAAVATLGEKEIKAKQEAEDVAKRDAYLKSPEGRIQSAYERLKEKELNLEAEMEAKRRLDLEKLTTKRKYNKEEYRKILKLKLSGKVKREEEAKK